jgi:GNAT superfamily N-acetyltransferase
MTDEVVVRRRVDADITHCVAIAELVHERDGYPIYLPTDLEQFIVSRDALAAWVAVDGASIVGHVALHPTSMPQVMTCARDFLGAGVEIGVVARLFVAPSCRRRGVAQRLLATAAAEARARGLAPILDVVTTLVNAIALYDRAGWVCAGTVRLYLPDGSELDELVYVAPAVTDSDAVGP